MQKGIGDKMRNGTVYSIKYSKKNVMVSLFAEPIICFIIVFSIFFILSAFLGSSFFYETYRFFIYLFLIAAILSLLTSFINYCRQRKVCKRCQIEVNGTKISVRDSFKKRKIRFTFGDIKNYTVINCGYSINEVIKLEIEGSKKVMIYSLMKNYRRLKSAIKKSNILGTDYIYKPLGYTEENVY